ncbi:YafY family transcriptional regulator [Paenibacillus oenotherae]|uniref:YafY family transcriptional regulator n=1 Tax=Paenibacillus oenotherae TaxID=1435645 RepID=A0ABS7D8G4_9BACL|nr:YafY family protein [Paenibacillus oenotherae]MBW7475463.1 YafY family transcriptional regulator [Paenibacillus oenotherae]
MKIERLLAIVIYVLNNGRTTASLLARKFEVSNRTIQRDMEAIDRAGIPIVAYPGLHGGFEIMEGYRLSHQVLTKDELIAVMTGLRGLQSFTNEQDMIGILEKIRALLKKNDLHYSDSILEQWMIDLSPWSGNEAEKGKMELLRQAIRNKSVITFRYTNSQGVESHPVAEPASLIHKNSRWYLYAFCRTSGKAKLYRLSRIREIAVTPEIFEQGIEPYRASTVYADWIRNTPAAHLTLRFQPRARVRVEDSMQDGIIQYEADGTMLVKIVYPEDEWLYGMILSYGDAVEVIEPESIRAIIRDRAMSTWRLYT